MSRRDFEAIAAAIASTEALIEGNDQGGLGQSTLRIAVNQISASIAAIHPRFDAARFEHAALPLEAERRKTAILRALDMSERGRS